MSLSDVVGASLSSLNPSPFFSGWLQSRRWRLLLTGVPVAVLVIGIFALRVTAYRRDSSGLIEDYLAEAGRSLQQGDDIGAKLRLRRAALIDAHDARVQFGLASLVHKEGDEAGARRMMESLANDSGTVGVQAAKWLLDHTKQTQIGADDRRLAIKWLEKIHSAEPANVDVRVKLATAYAGDGQIDKAIEELRTIVPLQSKLRIPLIQLLLGQGRKAEAQSEAVEAERIFRAELEADPDGRDARFAYAAVLVHQSRFKEAMQVLQATKPDATGTSMQRSVSAVASAWAAHLQGTKAEPVQILELTGLSLRNDPSNQRALLILMGLARDAGTSEEAVHLLEEHLAAGVTPWLTHMILGTVLLEKGDMTKGTDHLEQSVSLNPAAAVALNNLAWTLAHNEPVDLDRAETLVSKAIQMVPQNVHFRETRGQVLLKLGRWKEALADLEFVLPFYSGDKALQSYLPTLHEALAKGYEGLGNTSMAAQHRKLAGSGSQDRNQAGPSETGKKSQPGAAENAP